MKLQGIVQKGAGQATEIAIPTANLPTSGTIPPPGIYAAQVELANTPYNAIAYIGKAWLLNGAPERLEVHLFDYNGPSFYGEKINLDLQKKIRDPIEFTSEEQAKEQIEQDIQNALAFFKTR